MDVVRNGRRLRIIPVEPASRLDRLSPHPGAVTGDPADLVDVEWSGEWHP